MARPGRKVRALSHSLAALLLAAPLAAPLAGCSVDDVSSDSADLGAQHVAGRRRLLLCQQGLSDRTLDWDKGLFALCEGAEKAGFTLVRDGTYPAFGALDENGAYRALFQALDDNHDGWVDGADTATEVHLVGFSWGGINVTDLANRLGHDAHVAVGRRGVMAMVLLDPFQPQRFSAPVPANVAHAWEYRQTETTKGDCSMVASLGFGFNGLPPKLKSGASTCAAYDLDGFMTGVGHCDVPVRARAAALENLTKLRDYAPWAAHAEDCAGPT